MESRALEGPLIEALGSGGAYAVLGFGWLLIAIGFILVSWYLSTQFGLPNDGCLQGFACAILTLIGGGVGLLLAPYPNALLTSFGVAFLLPLLATLFFWTKNRRRRRP